MDLPKSFNKTEKQPHFSVIKHDNRQKTIASILELDSVKKNILCKYIIAELELYNFMVTQFTASLNRNPDIFSNLNTDHVELFGNLCFNNLSVDEAKKNINFANNIELLSSLSETVKILFEIAKTNYNVLPFTKKYIAMEMLSFFIENHNEFKTKNKFGFHTLSKCDIYQRRHIQIHRSECKIVYNKPSNKSSIYIPHLSSPICVINGKNMTYERWEILIVHQKPNVIPTPTTEWIAEFRPCLFKYILRYMDKKN
jgi:hypothetical protein